MKAYYIKTVRREHASFVLDALRQALRERFKIHHADQVFSLNYDREDQFFLKTPDMIYWAKIHMAPLTYQDALKFEREFEGIRSRFQTQMTPVLFCASLQSGIGILAGFKVKPYCFEFSLLKSDSGTSLALKDLSFEDVSVRVTPPEGGAGKSQFDSTGASETRPPLLSRSEIAELLEISLQSKRLNF